MLLCFISLISISQFSPLQLANRRADPGDGANDLVARYDRVDKRHDTALLVVHRMQVGMADTAEQDFDLHIALGWLPAGSPCTQPRRRVGRRVVPRIVHRASYRFAVVA